MKHLPTKSPLQSSEIRALYDSAQYPKPNAPVWETYRLQQLVIEAFLVLRAIKENEPSAWIQCQTLRERLEETEPAVIAYEADQKAHPAPFTCYYKPQNVHDRDESE